MGRAEVRARDASARRRVASTLGQLAWLEGFPHAGGWYRLDSGELVALGGALLSATRRAARAALREAREPLAAEVGDVDAWWAIVDAKLAWCSAPRGALDLLDHAPPRVARQARAIADPALALAARAAGVAWAGQPARLASIVGWMATRGAWIDDVPTTVEIARLAHTATHNELAALRALAQVDAPDPAISIEELRNLERRLGGQARGATATAPRSPPVARAWRARLLRATPSVQRRALSLLAAVDPAALLAPWAAWERTHAARLDELRALAARAATGQLAPERRRQVIAGIQRLRTTAPAPVALHEILEDTDELAADDAEALAAVARRVCAALVDGAPVARAHLLGHLASLARFGDRARLAWLWDALAAALEAGATEALLGPWQRTLSEGRPAWVDHVLVGGLQRRRDAERLVAALTALAADGPITTDDAEHAAAATVAGLDRDRVRALVGVTRTIPTRASAAIARAIAALADGSATDLAAVAGQVLRALATLSNDEPDNVCALLEHAARSGAAWLVLAPLAAGDVRPLTDAAAWLTALPPARWPVLAKPAQAPWIARYPEALAHALRRLASVDPDAERTAARRLATDFPAPETLVTELAALRARSGGAAHLARRIANLEHRLAAPVAPSPSRLARLAAKLERAAATIGLARFTATVTEAAEARLRRAFPGGSWPVPLDRRTREILFALAGLEGRDRALAARLLRRRAAPPPWDLRDDPANAAFLARMRDAGVDPAPWLDPAPVRVTAALVGDRATRTAGAPHGAAALELALCGDPLEVFAMGAHFGTCLSPGSMSFVSVVANAADINKRVLYARRAGRVVGRCLLALTSEFAILTFHPYCHEGELDFASIVRAYVLALAAQMRTHVADRGDVALLMARDWYDDGARDLVARFGALDEARLALGAVEPSQLVPRLVEALGHPLDDRTLPLVLALPALRGRPALIVPLTPYVLAARTPAVHVAAAQLALDADEPALADRLLGDHAGAIDLAEGSWPIGATLARLRPSYALARLRATRARGVRGWHDEPHLRIAIAAVAMAALRRPGKARALYRQALTGAPSFVSLILPPYFAAHVFDEPGDLAAPQGR